MNKNNVNLLVYSLTPESGIKNTDLNLYYFYLLYFIYLARKIKKICACEKINLFLFIYSQMLE